VVEVAAAGTHGFTAELTSFVGREEEIAAVAGLLERARLVTVAGPGGVGKTRLAAEVARRVADRFADGVWLAELAGVHDPALVPAAVASALDVQLTSGAAPVGSLASLLARRQLLLVLDNCEHLRPVLADLCGSLLRAADDVWVLATSREPLGVGGESRYRLGPLPLPASGADAGVGFGAGAGTIAGSAAMTLFADRAQMADSAFRLDSSTSAAVARLVTRLDGMPLAIELAAARVEALGVTQLAGLLDDGFRLLAAADPRVADRHRTLAATAEWSYQLLGERERHVFRMLAVLPGSFTLEAARAVAGPGAEDSVLRLVDCSLLAPPRAGVDGRARYLMLQTLRSFASDRLAPDERELVAASAGLAHYALSVAEQAAAALNSSAGELAAARWLDAEDATMHQTLVWALEHDAAVALRLAVALTPWWSLRGRYTAGGELLSAACRSVPEGSPQWCTVQVCLGRLTTGTDETVALGHYTAARDALADGPPTPTLADALAGRANCLLNLDRTPEAAGEARRALELARELRYPAGEVRAMWWLGSSAYYAGDHTGCLAWWLKAQRMDPARVPGSLVRRSTLFLAVALAENGELADAHAHCERALSLARQAGALFDEADVLMSLASVSLLMGRLPEARAYLCEAMELASRIGNDLFVFDCLDLTGHLCAQTRRYAEALTVWAADAALRQDGGITLPAPEAQRREEPLRQAREALGVDRARAAQTRGEVMTMSLAADYAALLIASEVHATAEDSGSQPAQPLSTRERELVTLVAQGRTNAEIAKQLYISVRTVGSHLDRIRDKTGCRRRADLTRLALQAGLV
jgi:predicted ATPase/DNA-binding CsgD family transcriptional regulator